ncbi:MAG: hypothetical protein ACOX5J_11530, partial [Candidatus Hydrogenedentales bacterium]
GMTRQVWLTFHPQSIDAGTHSGEIVLSSAQHGEQRFPVEMRVYPFEFPARPTLAFRWLGLQQRSRQPGSHFQQYGPAYCPLP